MDSKKYAQSNSKGMIILIIAIVVIIGAVSAFEFLIKPKMNHNQFPQDKNLFGEGNRTRLSMQNISLSEEQITQVTSVFSSGSPDDILSYCSQNRPNCFYYCRNINQSHEYCASIAPPMIRGNRTRGAN